MVFFSCNECGDSLKKNQVDKHMGRCRSRSFACIDCNEYFDTKTFREHIKCISENERYGGLNYVAKENKIPSRKMDVTPTPKHRGRFDSLSEEFPLPAPSPDFGLQPLAEYTGTGPDWMKIYRQELEEEAKREAEEDLAKALENQKLEDA